MTTSPAPTTSVAPAPTATPSTTASTTTIALTSNDADDLLIDLGLGDSGELSGDDAVRALAALDEHRTDQLRASTGFTTTASQSRWSDTDEPPSSPETVEATVLASGNMWVSYPNGDWYHFDPAIGEARLFHTNQIGGDQAALVFTRPPLLHDYLFALGHDPLASLSWLGARAPRGDRSAVTDLTMAAVTHDGQPAVLVTSSYWVGARVAHTVDLATGLIVEERTTDDTTQPVQHSVSTLSEVSRADALPVDEMPPLPDGIEWSPAFPDLDPTALVGATIDAAADAFGSELVVTETAKSANLVLLEHNGVTVDGRVVAPDAPGVVERYVRVQSVQAIGLTRQYVSVSASRTANDGSYPDHYELVGDQLCRTPCRTVTPEQPVAFTATAGALAGADFIDSGGDWATQHGAGWLQIVATTPADAQKIANTLTRP